MSGVSFCVIHGMWCISPSWWENLHFFLCFTGKKEKWIKVVRGTTVQSCRWTFDSAMSWLRSIIWKATRAETKLHGCAWCGFLSHRDPFLGIMVRCPLDLSVFHSLDFPETGEEGCWHWVIVYNITTTTSKRKQRKFKWKWWQSHCKPKYIAHLDVASSRVGATHMLENEIFLERTAVGANISDPIVSRPQIHGVLAVVANKCSSIPNRHVKFQISSWLLEINLPLGLNTFEHVLMFDSAFWEG